MNRPLSALEHAAWILDQGIPQNFVIVARVSGPLTENVLRQSLDMVQERHPPLKFKIREGQVPEFVSDGVPKIPLRIVERKNENHWVEEVEKEMLEPLPFTKGPLVRAMQLIFKDNYDLLFTFCHVVADATSGINFVKNVLRIAEKLSQGIIPEPNPPLPMLPSSLDLLKKDLKFKPEFLDISGRIMRTFHKPVELEGDREISIEKRITRVIQRILDPDETKKLAVSCKKEKTSIHGALIAAFLQAVVEQIRQQKEISKKSPLMIGCTTPVNMRDLFSRPMGEEIGDYISHALHFQMVHESASLWHVARKVKKSLKRELKFRRDIKATSGIGELLEAFSTPMEIVKALEDEFPPVAVTNMGRLDINEQFGDLALVELHFAVSINPACKNGFAIAVTTHRGRMTLNFLYAEPYISKERANIIVESTMKRLKEAIRE
jgi:NRPS condensation-like uncharacterized protein